MIEEQEKIKIENMIYEIRGKQVMLDSDLAKLYQCKNGTKSINLAVNRNKNKFPEDFYFQVTKEEYSNLRFQIETTILKRENINMNRSLPYVFTEQGVAMLATVIHTNIAAEVSINIMRTFVMMRKYLSTNLIEQKYINNQVMKNTEDIRLLQESFHKFESKTKTNEIYFNGQIYDAYSKIIDIMKEA
ncbi:MAG: ORF6N domain-containing protein, partial [Bacilli bacterium]